MYGERFKKLSGLLIDNHFMPEYGFTSKRCGNHEVDTLDSACERFYRQSARRRYAAVQFCNKRGERIVLVKDPKVKSRLSYAVPSITDHKHLEAATKASQDPKLAHYPSAEELAAKLESLLAENIFC